MTRLFRASLLALGILLSVSATVGTMMLALHYIGALGLIAVFFLAITAVLWLTIDPEPEA